MEKDEKESQKEHLAFTLTCYSIRIFRVDSVLHTEALVCVLIPLLIIRDVKISPQAQTEKEKQLDGSYGRH